MGEFVKGILTHRNRIIKSFRTRKKNPPLIKWDYRRLDAISNWSGTKRKWSCGKVDFGTNQTQGCKLSRAISFWILKVSPHCTLSIWVRHISKKANVFSTSTTLPSSSHQVFTMSGGFDFKERAEFSVNCFKSSIVQVMYICMPFWIWFLVQLAHC